MNRAKLDEAWRIFDKAASLEARVCSDESKSESMKNVARKHADKTLDEAVRLEAEAFAE